VYELLERGNCNATLYSFYLSFFKIINDSDSEGEVGGVFRGHEHNIANAQEIPYINDKYVVARLTFPPTGKIQKLTDKQQARSNEHCNPQHCNSRRY